MNEKPSHALDAARAGIPYRIRPMHLEDMDGVLAIERASFPLPWPASAFRYDLTKNDHAHYFVATFSQPPALGSRGDPEPSSLREPINAPISDHVPTIVGYVGYWDLVDEAHIANLAVVPAWRGRGLGELLLLTVLDHAGELGMILVTLEVRASNHVAQALYRKYGFDVAGKRRRYYSDNGEDALIMTTAPLSSARFQGKLEPSKAALARRLGAVDR